VRKTDRNTTYLIPVTEEMIGKRLEAVVLKLGSRKWSWSPVEAEKVDLKPQVWITAYPNPYATVDITL
jgi:hypothetical protein